VIVVVEDNHHKMLIYRYLIQRGCNRRVIRIESSPAGAGSAEQWVRIRFTKEVKVFRRRVMHTEKALLVLIDADTLSVQQRLRQLDEGLRDSGEDRVDPKKEQIARLIPRRNVATWILCLNATVVDEEFDYKREHHDWNCLISPAALTLEQWVRSQEEVPNHCVDSLSAGLHELRRLQV
jgi:hypothetical protein